MSKERLFTGLQPSGTLHIGNYFGALKPFVEQYEDYDSFLMIADYHALTTVRSPETLRANTYNCVLDYLAVGVDPERAVIFRQSDVKEHMEAAWIFECLVTVPFLQQAHSYKDKVARGLEATAGLFNYPMLMAADILLYDTAVVPVGKDQKQHIEYAREVAVKFNNTYGDTLKMPKALILDSGETVLGTDGQKMSKSYKNTIPLFGTRDEVVNAVMSIVTDSEGKRPENVFAIHKLFSTESELDILHRENEGNYKALKEALIADIETLFSPMVERREKFAKDAGAVNDILEMGARKARVIAEDKMDVVRKKIGIR
jgi:tryptophanyl-tRNA synthetase